MKRGRNRQQARGFTLIEILAAMGIFLLVTGAAFALLTSSQQRYTTESQVLNSFQEARLGLDQMVRDINDAGFPSKAFSNGAPSSYAVAPFAWSAGAGYPANPCQVGTLNGPLGTCTTANDSAPGDFDIIIETNTDPKRDPGCAPTCPTQWIRYQLGGPNGTTLMRGVADKTAGNDPDGATAANLAPFVQSVVNNSPNLVIGQFQVSAAYPALFQGGAAVPLFQYTCDTPSAPQNPPPPPQRCPGLGADNSPANIRDVMITLIVASPVPDATNGRPRLVQLAGRGRRINPNQ